MSNRKPQPSSPIYIFRKPCGCVDRAQVGGEMPEGWERVEVEDMKFDLCKCEEAG